MKFQSSVLLIPFIICCYWVSGQKTNQVTIIADITQYNGKLPVSSHPIWEGSDTLVPLGVNYKIPETMGAEYIVFPNRLDGDSISPNNESLRSVYRKIWRTVAIKSSKTYTWKFSIDKPCVISNSSLLGGVHLVLPGDSIYVSYNNGNPVFSGRGSDRFRLIYDIKKARENVVYPAGEKKPKEISRFLALNEYLNEQITRTKQILEANKSLVSQYEYEWIKAKVLVNTEYYRWFYFVPLIPPLKESNLSYTSQDLIRVWDSTMYSPDAVWYRSAAVQNLPGIGNRGHMKSFILNELYRKFKFIEVDSLQNPPIIRKLSYNKIKSEFTGLFRERLLCYFINEEITEEMGSYSWFAQSILKDYYNTPGYPAYKKWMKEWEKAHPYLANGKDGVGRGGAPLFLLEDGQGNQFTRENTVGKFTIVNFWYSGCEPCKQASIDLAQLQAKCRKDTNIVFLHVSTDTDKNKWVKSINEGIYVPKEGIQLYTGGQGREHKILQDFDVTSFPTIRMYDHNGRIVIGKSNPFANTYSNEQLIAFTGNQLTRFKDGPYVFFKGSTPLVYSITDKKAEQTGSVTKLTSSTDQIELSLNFSLQKQLMIPAAVYPTASKILILSDIEGNFTPLRQLLQANKVIDENFNWVFDKGHLVFAGDMFDRGEQVTECLWLIYSLEEKAKAAGGFVHFILGNHEIMNLQGNHRYVAGKYNNSAALMNITLTELYNKDSELGRWLRTKNVVEKIGDILFLHGGISSKLNQIPVTLEEINQFARPHLDQQKKDYGDSIINTIMSSSNGPFWFRGYYSRSPIISMVDSTLQKFEVNHIVTGHTIVADTISVHYNGKVINTDTKHASGKSEALLVEGKSFYRVSTTGNRILLFKQQSNLSNAISSRIE